MGLMMNGMLFINLFTMVFGFIVKLVALYTMYLAIKDLKIYIKKNQ